MTAKFISAIKFPFPWWKVRVGFVFLSCPLALPAQDSMAVYKLKVEGGTVTYNVRWHDAGSSLSPDTVTAHVAAATPPYAASTQTWTFGAQAWSDRIVAAPSNCTKTNSLTTSDYTKAEYRVYDGRYYYSWTCVNKNRDAFCPSSSGWRLPTRDHFNRLRDHTAPETLYHQWLRGGYATGASMYNTTTYAYYWSATSLPAEPNHAYGLYYYVGKIVESPAAKYYGQQVRCVKQ